MVQHKTNFLTSLFQTKGQTKSYFFMLISCVTWVSGYVFANQNKFSPIETNLSRSIVMVIGSYIICRIMNLNIEFKSPKSWYTLLKRHFSFIVQGLVIAGVQFVLPLGITHTIASAGPIVTLVMQRMIYKDPAHQITGRKLQGCIIAVFGILFTSNGKYIYSYFNDSFEFNSSFQNYVSQSYSVMIIATIILITAMIVWSYGVLITQQAECHAFQIVFHFAVMNLLFSSFTYIFLPQKQPAQQMYLSLIWIGVFLLIAQISFTLALNLAENIALTNITSFMVVVVGYCISIFRYDQTVDIISLMGTVLVLGGVSLVILTKQNKNSQEKISDGQNQLDEVLKKQNCIKQIQNKI